MKFFKKPLLLAVTAFTLLGATGCSNDSLSKGDLMKIALAGGGAAAGAYVGSQMNPGSTGSMVVGAGAGGILGLGLGSLIKL